VGAGFTKKKECKARDVTLDSATNYNYIIPKNGRPLSLYTLLCIQHPPDDD